MAFSSWTSQDVERANSVEMENEMQVGEVSQRFHRVLSIERQKEGKKETAIILIAARVNVLNGLANV